MVHFGDVILNHDLWLDVECNFTYAIKAILVVMLVTIML